MQGLIGDGYLGRDAFLIMLQPGTLLAHSVCLVDALAPGAQTSLQETFHSTVDGGRTFQRRLVTGCPDDLQTGARHPVGGATRKARAHVPVTLSGDDQRRGGDIAQQVPALPTANAVLDKLLEDVRRRVKAPLALQEGTDENHEHRWCAQTQAHPPVQRKLGGGVDQDQLGEALRKAMRKVYAQQPAGRVSEQDHWLMNLKAIQHSAQVVGDGIDCVAVAGSVRSTVTPQVGGDAAGSLREMPELVHPLQGVTASSLDEE